MKIKFILTICLPILFFTGLSCNSPTEPKDSPVPDTTSHNFVWRVDTIGYYQSLVRDVAVISENDIWAVGTFYKKHQTQDSTENDRYNAAHWDGERWELRKYYPQTFVDYSTNSTPDFPYELRCIWVINLNNIWAFSLAGSYIHLLKNEVSTKWIESRNGSINKIWGKDENNIWFVGEKGTILYYNGSTFTKIPYSDEYDFVDVWGDETGVVRAVARKPNGFFSDIVKITTSSAVVEINGLNSIANGKTPDLFYSVWWKSNETKLWVAADNGTYTWQKGNWTKYLNNYEFEPWVGTLQVRGTQENNVVLCGINGQIMHFNGQSLHFFRNLYTPLLNYTTLSVKDNIMCSGGFYLMDDSMGDLTLAVVCTGRRI